MVAEGKRGEREEAGKAYRFKIESNQINLQASLVMEKYAKFQLGKTRCEAQTLHLSISPPIPPWSTGAATSLSLQVHSHKSQFSAPITGKSFFPRLVQFLKIRAAAAKHFKFTISTVQQLQAS